ncbi:MAG: DUF1801 domain-containing protein [Bacteroidota bacterium]
MPKPAEIKTKATASSVEDFISKLADEPKRKDCFTLVEIMEKISGEKARMWGASMIGFGEKRYKSPATGREVDWFKIGFAPRKANLSLHLILNFTKHAGLFEKLGKHKISGGCLHISKLEDVNLAVLEEIIQVAEKEK